MTNNHIGLSFSELFNRERIIEKPIGGISQFHMVKHLPYVYMRKAVGNEFELSRAYTLPEGIYSLPWRPAVMQTLVNRFILGTLIHKFSITARSSCGLYIKTMEIQFEYYSARFDNGKFYFPLTHSLIVNLKPYMEILDQLMTNAKFNPAP